MNKHLNPGKRCRDDISSSESEDSFGRYEPRLRSNSTIVKNKISQGSQGTVFRCLWNGIPAIMKMSHHIDVVLELQETAWNRLKELDCIHFFEVLKKIPLKPLFYNEISSKSHITSLSHVIYEHSYHPNAILNCIRQALAAMVMFERLGITHYDLHSDNVMITDTEYDVHFMI